MRQVVLIVEDETMVAHLVTRLLPRDLTRRLAPCAATAISMLRAHADWALFLIDVGLGQGGSGLDVLDVAIAEHPAVVRALVTGDSSAQVNNYARARSTDVIRKPFGAEELAPTLARVIASRSVSGELAAYIAALALRVGLSDREHEVLARLVAGEQRSELPAAMGVKKSTVDTFVAGIVAKASARNIRELVEAVLRSRHVRADTERRRR